MTIIKQVAKLALKKLGYEIKLIEQGNLPLSVPRWIQEIEIKPNTDDVISEGWVHNVLHMANKYYSPTNLNFLRTRIGEDYRIKYIAYTLDFRDQRVLELGPLEGHWSILIEKMGAKENISLEAKQKNYIKCMRIKNKYGLSHTKFYQLDIEDLYNHKTIPPFTGKFDLIFCIGLFYHLPNPPKALTWFLSQSDTLFLGTHYVEKQFIECYHQEGIFSDASVDYRGESYKGKWYSENVEADSSGMSPHSFWPYEVDLIRMLEQAGYQQIQVLGKDYLNNFPHITILAKRL
ncbi:MAG: methyltransferase domain-containing protein [Desulfamplus sp.]|nr:methyltransferase domain-containing protein [Desulfamplus sp.]